MTEVDEKLDRHIILLSLWILDICSTLPESDTMTVPPSLSLCNCYLSVVWSVLQSVSARSQAIP